MADADVIYRLEDLIDESVLYPDSDGQPISDNTRQADWIVLLKGNLDALFAADPGVFVAMDNLWYPVRGKPKERLAPDVYAVFGRPKGHRSSYKQWEEDGVPVTVAVEILSPRNSAEEMADKLSFYALYGAEEFIVIGPDPEALSVQAWVRGRDGVVSQAARLFGPADGAWTSPRLGLRFTVGPDDVLVSGPDGQLLRTFVETEQLRAEAQARADAEAARADAEADRADAEATRADAEADRADAEAARAERLTARLRELGVDPDAAG